MMIGKADWVAVTCDVPYYMYGIKHSGTTEYVKLSRPIEVLVWEDAE